MKIEVNLIKENYVMESDTIRVEGPSVLEFRMALEALDYAKGFVDNDDEDWYVGLMRDGKDLRISSYGKKVNAVWINEDGCIEDTQDVTGREDEIINLFIFFGEE